MKVLEFKAPVRTSLRGDDVPRVPPAPRPRRPFEMLLRRGVAGDLTFIGHDRCGHVVVEVRVAENTLASEAMPALDTLVRTLDAAKWRPR